MSYVPPHKRGGGKTAVAPLGLVSRGDSRLVGDEETQRAVLAKARARWARSPDDPPLYDLRMLREAIVAGRSASLLAEAVFELSVEIGVETGHYQTYVPALEWLAARGKALYVQLLVLHYSHVVGDLQAAWTVVGRHRLEPVAAVEALATGNWHKWFTAYASASKLEQEVMNGAKSQMALLFVKTTTAAYYQLPPAAVETLTALVLAATALPPNPWTVLASVITVRTRK